jgi:SAM-dependent methyltransferase
MHGCREDPHQLAHARSGCAVEDAVTNADEIAVQRDYYASTAARYEEMHLGSPDHGLALRFLIACIDFYRIRSILDIGSGTGHVIREIKAVRPDVKVVGVEPSAELREIGYRQGLGPDDLVDGDGLKLDLPNGTFDLCCEFGVLHHVKSPRTVIDEMLRVSRKAIFISDSNNFGQGSPAERLVKQLIDAVGLWKVINFIKTRGKGYSISEGDGLAYSYSVFNDYGQIERSCRIHLLNTGDARINPYRTAAHVALLGVKRR